MKHKRVTAEKHAAGRGPFSPRDQLAPKGRVEVFVTRGKPSLDLYDPLPTKAGFPLVHRGHRLGFEKAELLEHYDIKNIIVNGGKDKVIESLTSGFIHIIARMAIGDRGTIPADPTVPKVPVETQDALFNEVYRDDVDATVLNVGTPTTHEVKFIKTFSSLVIPITSFSNQAAPTVNEVGLITADVFTGAPLPRPPVAAPNAPDVDEKLFSIRTFKSVPFESANEISVTIRYTIYIE